MPPQHDPCRASGNTPSAEILNVLSALQAACQTCRFILDSLFSPSTNPEPQALSDGFILGNPRKSRAQTNFLTAITASPSCSGHRAFFAHHGAQKKGRPWAEPLLYQRSQDQSSQNLSHKRRRSWDRRKLDERWNFALPGSELPTDPTAKLPAKETSAGPALQCHSR